MLTASRLTLARQRRGLTKKQLAEESGVSLRTITALENEQNLSPSEETIRKLATVLGFPGSFFSHGHVDLLSPSLVNFRALSRMTASQRDAALAVGAFASEFVEWLDKRFKLPEVAIPDFRGMKPENAAQGLRELWGLGEKTIGHMIALLESKGVRVFSLVEECMTVDAFSLWRSGRPYVFLNTMKSAERSRFDAAHELGHLVLHREIGADGSVAEREADQFASAFLMPRRGILGAVPHNPSMSELLALKKRWKVSLAALAHRTKACDLMTDWHYRNVCIEIAKNGYRKDEPDAMQERERSRILPMALEELRKDGIGITDIARDLHLAPSELSQFLLGIGAVAGSGMGSGSPGERPNLKLVR